jgi:hypothetical protein
MTLCYLCEYVAERIKVLNDPTCLKYMLYGSDKNKNYSSVNKI